MVLDVLADRKRLVDAEREQRLLAEALRDTATALSSTLNLDEVLDRILLNVGRVVPHEAIFILLVQAGIARVVRMHGIEDSQTVEHVLALRLPVESTPNLRQMAETRQPLVIPDIQQYPGWTMIPSLSWLRSYAGAPICIQGDPAGFLSLDSATPGFFTPVHAERLQAFADQAALAIQNARLYEETRQHAERLTLINEITTAINQPLELKAVLQALVDGLAQALAVNQAALALFDEKRQHLVGFTDHTAPGGVSAVGREIPLEGNRSVEQILRTKAPLFIADALNDPLMASVRELMLLRGVRSILLVPLIVKGEVWGTIGCDVVGSTRHFDDEEIKLAETIANLAATRIEQARLFEAESQARQRAEVSAAELREQAYQMALLNDITSIAVGAPDLHKVLPALAGHLGELVGADGVCITLWDEEQHAVLHTASFGRLKKENFWLRGEAGEVKMTAAVLENDRPLIADDMLSSPVSPHIGTQSLIRSMLGLPLIVDRKKLGAALIAFNRPHHFTPQEIALCEQAARQVALAVSKGQLLEAERQQTAQLTRANSLITALSGVASQIQTAPDIDGVLSTLSAELKKLGINCLLALKAENEKGLQIRFLSIESPILSKIEKITGLKKEDFRFSPDRFPFYNEIINNQSPIFTEFSLQVIKSLLPGVPLPILKHMLQVVRVEKKSNWILLPLSIEKTVIGMLWVWGQGLENGDVPAASIFASQVTNALEKARLYAEVQQLAITDELTGLYNRRGLFELGRREVARALRFGHPLSAVMIDIDHFKKVNDTYGHPVGDQVLKVLAERLQANLRGIEIIGRYGGEEFVILLIENNQADAVYAAERLRQQIVGELILSDMGPISITVSIGVAAVTQETKDLAALIQRADRALYHAKRSGRNRISTVA